MNIKRKRSSSKRVVIKSSSKDLGVSLLGQLKSKRINFSQKQRVGESKRVPALFPQVERQEAHHAILIHLVYRKKNLVTDNPQEILTED